MVYSVVACGSAGIRLVYHPPDPCEPSAATAKPANLAAQAFYPAGLPPQHDTPAPLHEKIPKRAVRPFQTPGTAREHNPSVVLAQD
jgi:hypothetical protein